MLTEAVRKKLLADHGIGVPRGVVVNSAEELARASFVVCPPVVAYDRAFQERLADEIQRLPPGPALERAMLDYARLRDQERACEL